VVKRTSSYTSMFQGIKQLFVGLFSSSNFPPIFLFIHYGVGYQTYCRHQNLAWLLAMSNTNFLSLIQGCPELFERRCLRAAHLYPVLVVNPVPTALSELQQVEGFGVCRTASIS